MKRFYSNGKLLLTGEYVVLDGAISLAIPTKFGQDLTVEPIANKQLIWSSFTLDNDCWFEAAFDLPQLRLVSCSFISDREGAAETIAETLQTILQEAKKMNPAFLETTNGFAVKTTLTFPQNWGMGSSSTLINNVALWADIDAYSLLWNAFSGSGYDIACAKHNTPILFQLANQQAIVTEIDYAPSFQESLFFVHLNKKQNSRDGIHQYKTYQSKRSDAAIKKDCEEISNLSKEFLQATTCLDLEKIIVEHESMISSIIQINPVKKELFSDYFGAVKSLGAWGGDFLLVTGNEDTPNYFKKRGFETVLPYSKTIL